MDSQQSPQSRRGARVSTAFLVAIDGIDAAPRRRTGDISATGVYFDMDRDIGAAGTVQWLHLESFDSARVLRVMACVVRTVQLSDASGHRVWGAAFEFMPESDEKAVLVQEFVRYVLDLRSPDSVAPRIAERLDARVDDHKAQVRQLSVRSVVLQTSWAMAPGERVRLDIVAPGMTRRIRLEGRAVRVAPRVTKERRPGGYDIEVEIDHETARPVRIHSSLSFPAVRPEDAEAAKGSIPAAPPSSRTLAPASEALDDLLAALILPPEETSPPRRHHLSGEMSRIRLPSLLALFEMDRMTGKVSVKRRVGGAATEFRVYVRDGQVFDVEPILSRTRRDVLAELLASDDGTFQFTLEPVDRPDRIGVSTTALLLDLARESDEAGRPR
jgi:hypothetical protein